MARERIDMLRPLEAGERRPFGLSLPRSGDGGVDVLRRTLRNARDALAARGIEDIEQVAGFGEDAVDEMSEAASMILEPDADMLAAFRRGTVVHRAQDVLDDAHEFASRHCVAMGGRIAPGRVMVELTLDVGQKPACAGAA